MTPPQRLLTTRDVVEITTLSTASLYRLIDQGQFPSQVQMGPQSVGWYLTEVIEWVRSRPAAEL